MQASWEKREQPALRGFGRDGGFGSRQLPAGVALVLAVPGTQVDYYLGLGRISHPIPRGLGFFIQSHVELPAKAQGEDQDWVQPVSLPKHPSLATRAAHSLGIHVAPAFTR